MFNCLFWLLCHLFLFLSIAREDSLHVVRILSLTLVLIFLFVFLFLFIHDVGDLLLLAAVCIPIEVRYGYLGLYSFVKSAMQVVI